MRRTGVIATVGSWAVLVLGAGGAAASSVPPPPTEPGTTTDADQAAAEAALLTLADFPSGWIEVPADELTDMAVESRRRIAECAGGEGDSLLDLGGGLAESGNFRGPDDENVEESVAVVELVEAEDLMARLGSPGVDDCFADAMQDSVEELVANPPDPSQAFPEDAAVGKVTAGPLDVTAAGDELVAYRIVVPITTQGLTVDIVLDAVVVRSGRSIAGLSFQSVLTAFSMEDIDHYVALASDRLPP